jgi:endonuclease/exonuclease/phosphatase family metal-dependent hydrolase
MPSGPATARETVPLRVGSYNIQWKTDTNQFRAAVNSLTERSDVAGLQEVNRHEKEDVLRNLDGWGYYRPDERGAQNPVIWNKSRFSFVSASSPLIAPGGRYIGNEIRGRGPLTFPIYAVVVHLRDLLTDQRVSIVNVHLLPGATLAGRPYPGRPRTYRAFRDSVINLGRLASREKAEGRVYVVGDFNIGWLQDRRAHLKPMPYMTFRRLYMRSMWQHARPSGNRGSHQGSPALIDQVWAQQGAAASRVYFAIRYSDHFPVVARYNV